MDIGRVGLVLIDEKMRGSLLRLFGHQQRRAINAIVRKSELIQVKRMRKR